MNDVCFILGKTKLYIDEYLVDFDIPIFFVCKDDNNSKYAVECINTTDLIYVISKVDINDTLKMLNNEITLSDFIRNGKEYWFIKSGDSVENDNVEKNPFLNPDMLPKENTYFELTNEKISNYIKKLNEEKNNVMNEFCITDFLLENLWTINVKTVKIANNNLYRKRRKVTKKTFSILMAGSVFG